MKKTGSSLPRTGLSDVIGALTYADWDGYDGSWTLQMAESNCVH